MRALRYAVALLAVGAAAAIAVAPFAPDDVRAADSLAIDDYGPRVLARGERVTISGNFSALDGAKPRVFGTSDAVRGRVAFRVVEWNEGEIVARVRRIARSRRSARDGIAWQLHVAPRSGVATVAAEPFVTTAPIIRNVSPGVIHAGWPVRLTVECLGTNRPRVTFGGVRVPQRDVWVEPAEPGTRERHVWIETPDVRSIGDYEITVAAKRALVSKSTALQVATCKDPGFPRIPNGNKVVANLKSIGGFEHEFNGFGSGFRSFNLLLVQGCDDRPDSSCRETCTVSTTLPEVGQTGPRGAFHVTYMNEAGDSWESLSGEVQITKSVKSRIEGTFSARLSADSPGAEPETIEIRGSFSVPRAKEEQF